LLSFFYTPSETQKFILNLSTDDKLCEQINGDTLCTSAHILMKVAIAHCRKFTRAPSSKQTFMLRTILPITF